jgi:hypothetical protein
VNILLKIFLLTSFGLSLNSCAKQEDDLFAETSAEQVGDVMASIDEMGGSSGSYAMMLGEQKVFARHNTENLKDRLLKSLLPKAMAATCSSSTFGSCTNNRIVRNFNDCNIGNAVFSGTVTLDYVDAATDNTCAPSATGNTISRDPDFTISGLHSATYTVSKTGTYGQRLTRTGASALDFSNDGIRRVIKIGTATVADYTTTTTSNIGVTGNARSGRVISGGNLHVVNNSSGTSCDFVPSNVTWNSTCGCPVSGSWLASCSSGKTGSLTITSCGEATYTIDGQDSAVSFDRCSRF